QSRDLILGNRPAPRLQLDRQRDLVALLVPEHLDGEVSLAYGPVDVTPDEAGVDALVDPPEELSRDVAERLVGAGPIVPETGVLDIEHVTEPTQQLIRLAPAWRYGDDGDPFGGNVTSPQGGYRGGVLLAPGTL